MKTFPIIFLLFLPFLSFCQIPDLGKSSSEIKQSAKSSNFKYQGLYTEPGADRYILKYTHATEPQYRFEYMINKAEDICVGLLTVSPIYELSTVLKAMNQKGWVEYDTHKWHSRDGKIKADLAIDNDAKQVVMYIYLLSL